MTFTPIAACLEVELSLPDFTTYVCLRLGFEHQTFRLRGERSNLLRHHRGETLVIPS